MGPMLDSGGAPAPPRGPQPDGSIRGAPDPDHFTPLSETPVRDAPREPVPLGDLLRATATAQVLGDPSVAVSSVVYSSTEVEPGSLFFAVSGTHVDGHDFAEAAERAGAVAIVVERRLPVERAQVVVPSVREAMGPISAEFYGRPAERMTVVGVTGTNGKTTTTYLLESVFRAAGLVPGVIGTTGVRIDGRPEPFPRTTPEAPDLHRLLARMADEGVQAVAMEVSSHGLDQHRVGGVRYACAVFTNLTQDHLDYHGSLEEYFGAKAKLFTPELTEHGATNWDSPEGRRLMGAMIPMTSYGLEEGADVRATDVATDAQGVSFRVGDVEVRSRLRGLYNVSNCLSALAAGGLVGIDPPTCAAGIAALAGVPGRMEPVEEGQDFLVIVDYAHTPDSLENVLRAARPLAAEGGERVIIAFGCGGDRDRGKRPLMGEACTRLADLTIVTSDNPRSEDPLDIIREIEPGARAGGGRYVVEPDRRAAIALAVREAGPGDVVVIAGKGHETGQEFADRTVPFDDRVVAAEELRALLGASTGGRT
jgi:UDP-N-acetylmuramoyl-L-alanyl-D-glutamate--2,6-diaminopimelate ligase